MGWAREAGLGAEGVELGHGAAEFAVDHGFVADQAVEIVDLGHDAAGSFGRIAAQGVREFGYGGLGARAGVGDGDHLETGGTGQAPVAQGDALDEEVVEGALGAELATDAFEQGVEVFGGFGGVGFEDGVGGEQAVLDGVLGDGGFALGRAGAGAHFGFGISDCGLGGAAAGSVALFGAWGVGDFRLEI